MARLTGYMITYDDANYMITNNGFTRIGSIITGLNCLSKSEIIAYINAEPANFTAYASNRLVPYNLLVPIATIDVTPPVAGTLTWTGLGSAGYFNYTSVPLTWTLATDNVRVARMEVQMKINAGAWTNVQTYIGTPPTTTAYTHNTTRNTQTAYYYRIYYADDAGNFSYSNEVSAVHDNVAPTVPTGLNWTSGSDGNQYL